MNIVRNLVNLCCTISTFLQHANYDLIVCGHSLGAGVAAILSMLLKPDYFSPPGGLLRYLY